MTAGLVSGQFLAYGAIKDGEWDIRRMCSVDNQPPCSTRCTARNRDPQGIEYNDHLIISMWICALESIPPITIPAHIVACLHERTW